MEADAGLDSGSGSGQLIEDSRMWESPKSLKSVRMKGLEKLRRDRVLMRKYGSIFWVYPVGKPTGLGRVSVKIVVGYLFESWYVQNKSEIGYVGLFIYEHDGKKLGFFCLSFALFFFGIFIY